MGKKELIMNFNYFLFNDSIKFFYLVELMDITREMLSLENSYMHFIQ